MSETELEDVASILFKGNKVRRRKVPTLSKTLKKKTVRRRKRKASTKLATSRRRNKTSDVIKFGVPILVGLLAIKLWQWRTSNV